MVQECPLSKITHLIICFVIQVFNRQERQRHLDLASISERINNVDSSQPFFNPPNRNESTYNQQDMEMDLISNSCASVSAGRARVGRMRRESGRPNFLHQVNSNSKTTWKMLFILNESLSFFVLSQNDVYQKWTKTKNILAFSKILKIIVWEFSSLLN